MGFQPGNRQSEVTNEGEEVLVIPVAITDTFSDLDFVVEALQLAGADGENRVRDKAVQARPFQLGELHKGRNTAGLRCVEPALPALVGGKRVSQFEERTKLLLHRIADRKV